MAAPTIDKAFVQQYEREVHEAYQRQGSKLRNTVRTRANVVGATTTFQKIGTGTASQKARNGLIKPMSLDHSPVECSLSDWYAGEWIDKLDELKESINERKAATNAGAWALGRKTDELIITALDGTTNSIAAAASGLTKIKIYEAYETLGNNDVFEEGKMFALVGYQQWTNLLDLPEFVNADYVGRDALPFVMEGAEVKRWMGTMWITHSGLPIASSTRKVFWYRDDAVGHASGSDVVTDITWHGDRAAWFVNNMMSQGAALIDARGVVEIQCTES